MCIFVCQSSKSYYKDKDQKTKKKKKKERKDKRQIRQKDKKTKRQKDKESYLLEYQLNNHKIAKIAPAYEGIELGIGETVLMKAIAAATGRTLAKIKEDYEVEGDLGSVAQVGKHSQYLIVKEKN